MTENLEQGAKSKLKFFPALEGLRGFAAIIVTLFHMKWDSHFFHLGLIRNGYLFVDFFFILSGFIMCHSYGHKLNNFELFKKFFFLRLGRLYPLHIFMLFVFVGIEVFLWLLQGLYGLGMNQPVFERNNGYSFLSNLVLLQAMGLHNEITWNRPSWSISVELYTYILYATVVLATPKKALNIVAIIISVISYFIVYYNIGSLTDGYYLAFFRCTMGFFLGVVLYTLYGYIEKNQFYNSSSTIAHLSETVIIITIAAIMSYKSIGASDFLMLPLFFLAILIFARQKGFLSELCSKGFMFWAGKTSYSIYMIHYAFIFAFSGILTLVMKVSSGVNVPDGPQIHTTLFMGDAVSITYMLCLLGSSAMTYKYIEVYFRDKVKMAIVGRNKL